MPQTTAAPLVFVVDDDKGLLRLVEKALQREGFRTVTASSFQAAVEWLVQHRPDLMLLDLKLEDIGGKELIDYLTVNNRSVPFIIITGQGDERVAVAMMKRGALDYLVKDADFLQFVPEVVRRTIGQLERDKKLAAAEEALRRSEAFSSTVLDTSAALVVVLDRSGKIVRFNRACEQTTGYSAAEIRGKNLWDLFIVPEEMNSVKAVFDRLRSGQFPNRNENYWRTRQGERRLVAWSNSVLLDDRGAVEYVIGVGIDITERRRLEQEILQISELEQRRIGQDLHDGLCQHLAATELMTEIVQQKIAKKSKADADRVAEIAKQVREAISQTRLLARGLSPVVLESEGLMSALQELADYTERMFRVGCHFVCPQPVLIHNHTTATHLYRIAQEAVSNAVRHGKAKRITISLQRTPEHMALQIQDDGVGLPLDSSRAKGMGLRIMQYRAAMVGGALTVQNRPQGGTSVLCAIQQPTAPKDDSFHDDTQASQDSQTSRAHRGRPSHDAAGLGTVNQ
jgi:PAS domain S-box-containing protein